MLKSIFSKIAQNDYFDISAVQNGDFDQIQTLSSIFSPKYGLGKILSILGPDMLKTAIFGQFQAIFGCHFSNSCCYWGTTLLPISKCVIQGSKLIIIPMW